MECLIFGLIVITLEFPNKNEIQSVTCIANYSTPMVTRKTALLTLNQNLPLKIDPV